MLLLHLVNRKYLPTKTYKIFLAKVTHHEDVSFADTLKKKAQTQGQRSVWLPAAPALVHIIAQHLCSVAPLTLCGATALWKQKTSKRWEREEKTGF